MVDLIPPALASPAGASAFPPLLMHLLRDIYWKGLVDGVQLTVLVMLVVWMLTRRKDEP